MTTAKLGASGLFTNEGGRAGGEYYQSVTRVLVIGARGMLGRAVAAAAAGVPGIQVVRSSREPLPGWVQFDAEAGAQATEQLLNAVGPIDLIVNCAGVLSSDIDPLNTSDLFRAERVNADFPRELALAALARGTHLVHVSTDAVFRDDAGRCLEDDESFAGDTYGSTKRRGEPTLENALTLRCSFVGRDPTRRRGLIEWLLARPRGEEVAGFVDQTWNGLTTSQVAAVAQGLLDAQLFERARREGPVHHLFEDPALSKYDLLVLCCETFGLDVTLVPAASGRPVNRVLGSRHTVLAACLESAPPRAVSLEAIAARHPWE
jgi:dTDP-4-dehydrorhamnose reductase